MHDIDRTPLRTYVYVIIVLYFAVLSIGGAIEFVLAVLGMGPMLSKESAQALEAFRTDVGVHLVPVARGAFRLWPEGGGMILAWPLVSLGLVALVAAIAFFSLVDLLRSFLKKLF